MSEPNESLTRERSLTAWGALVSLVLGYGAFAAIALRYLYRGGGAGRRWQFVAPERRLRKIGALTYRAPSGAEVAVACQGTSGQVEDFIALSSTCPHLGCQVHWEAQNERFFCPCHNGVFDPAGRPVSGPPAEAGQELPRFPIKVERGLVFIGLPDSMLEMRAERRGITRPGHDACLRGGRERGEA